MDATVDGGGDDSGSGYFGSGAGGSLRELNAKVIRPGYHSPNLAARMLLNPFAPGGLFSSYSSHGSAISSASSSTWPEDEVAKKKHKMETEDGDYYDEDDGSYVEEETEIFPNLNESVESFNLCYQSIDY